MSELLNHFHRLYAYNTWANTHVLQALRDAQPEPAMRLFSHLLAAEHNWIGRITKIRGQDSGQVLDFFPLYSHEKSSLMAGELSGRWNALLNEIDPADLEHIIEYVSSEGKPYSSLLKDILSHVINHSTYHRAQVALALRQAGHEPAITDYILYTRQLQG